MSRILLLLALCLTAPAFAADLKLLGEAREHRFVTVESDKEGPWLVLGPNAAVVLEATQLAGTPVLGTPKINKADAFPINGTKGVKFVGPPGFYAVTQWPPGDAEASVLVVEIHPAKDSPPVITPKPPVEPEKPVDPPVKPATAAHYIYEKDKTAPPAQVLVALDKINREKKIIANDFDQNIVDGTGQVPDQYKVSIPAAIAAGLPALVVMSGDVVLRVVKDPRTTEAVLEAVR